MAITFRSTSCNMVAKRVQHVGFNNVGRCCINMLHPFNKAFIYLNDVKRKQRQISRQQTEGKNETHIQDTEIGGAEIE